MKNSRKLDCSVWIEIKNWIEPWIFSNSFQPRGPEGPGRGLVVLLFKVHRPRRLVLLRGQEEVRPPLRPPRHPSQHVTSPLLVGTKVRCDPSLIFSSLLWNLSPSIFRAGHLRYFLIFSIKKWVFCIFYQVIWTMSGLFNRTGAETGY